MKAPKDAPLPTIAPGSVATKLFVRAYAEPRQQRRYREREEAKHASSVPKPTAPARAMFDGTLFVFDTETVEHRLTFGAFEEWRRRKLVARAVFYADALPTEDAVTFERLRGICEALDVRLVSLEFGRLRNGL